MEVNASVVSAGPAPTLPHCGHVCSGVFLGHVKEPQRLSAYQYSAGLVSDFLAGGRVVPGDVVRVGWVVEDAGAQQGAVEHRHVPRNREHPFKLEAVIGAVVWKDTITDESLKLRVNQV